MKAISVQQPFASLIMCGRKPIDIRSWKVDYRGDILICASQRVYKGEMLEEPMRMLQAPSLLIFGVALCIVELVDIVPFKKGMEQDAGIPFIEGHFAWKLENIRHIPFFPVTGRLRLFDVLLPQNILP